MRRALLSVLRATHLIGLADSFAAQRAVWRTRDENRAYVRAHPERRFPDPRLVYEVAGHARLAQFDETGQAHAAEIAALLRDCGLPTAPRVLEWGCGPARILAHLPAALDAPGARFFGCDRDGRAIAFARQAHAGMDFQRIAPAPPAPYDAAAFDALYAISVFTHLDEAAAHAWAGELARLAAPGACVLVTTHGAHAAARLDGAARRAFDSGAYVALDGARMGSRVYVSYFNETAGRALFEPRFAQVRHRPGDGRGMAQDVWLLTGPRPA
jgi:SAM-dependent methyltransferase